MTEKSEDKDSNETFPNEKKEFYQTWYEATQRNALEFSKLGGRRASLIWFGYISIIGTIISIILNLSIANLRVLGILILFFIGYIAFITLTTAGFYQGELGCYLEAYFIEKKFGLGIEGRTYRYLIPINNISNRPFMRAITVWFYKTRLFSFPLVTVQVATLYTGTIVGFMISGWLYLRYSSCLFSAIGFILGLLIYILLIRTLVLNYFNIKYKQNEDVIDDILKKSGWDGDNRKSTMKEFFQFLIYKYLFSLKQEYRQHLKEGPIADELRKAFEEKKHPLPSSGQISKRYMGWVVTVEGKKKYTIEDPGKKLNIYKNKYKRDKFIIESKFLL